MELFGFGVITKWDKSAMARQRPIINLFRCRTRRFQTLCKSLPERVIVSRFAKTVLFGFGEVTTMDQSAMAHRAAFSPQSKLPESQMLLKLKPSLTPTSSD